MITESRLKEIVQKFPYAHPIIVVGDIGIDKYTIGEVKRISPEAPVPIIEVVKEQLKLGLAANVSHNLKTLGMNSTLCGVLGGDSHADIFERLLEDINLTTWGVVRDETRRTTYKERVVTDTQQICRVDYETKRNISEAVENRIMKRIKDFYKDHNSIIIEDYSKGTLTESLIKEIIQSGISNSKFVAVDPGKDTNPRFYENCSLIKPNLSEAKLIVQKLGYQPSSIEDMARIIQSEIKSEIVIITLGPDGMALLDSKEFRIIPTLAMEVFDVSGAGDTAISAIVASLHLGASLDEAAWIANLASGVVVGKKGTATVNVNELLSFYKRISTKGN